ncbi:MAG: MFS transporter [Pseudomonadota bacterium]|jgi:Arabinose efflux permease|nr:MAG: MFS transporter [Pseudomonadota bacterium]
MAERTIETDIPSRLDRLAWGPFHWLVVAALGITWTLDGLEVTLAGAVAGALEASPTLQMTSTEVGASASAYLAGAVLGALVFGWLTDVLGRKRLFFMTLGLYLAATGATAFAQDFWSFALFRFLTGAGIGGEYAAINSAIQELIPARYRGRTDLAINGSFWLGAILGAFGSSVLLDPERFPADLGWRLAFGIGAVLGLVVLVFRRRLPESPRWLILHGRTREADAIVSAIERRSRRAEPASPVFRLRLRVRRRAVNLVDLGVSLFRLYPRRAVLGLVLMASQAFFYNAIFFTYALVLGRFFDVPVQDVGLYLLPFSITNFLGPIALGWLFDHWGRRPMITLTYALSGLLLGVTALLFLQGALSAVSLTVSFAVVFFFASAAASSAYLTVSECFPIEVRALAIAVFYALGTGLGGVAAPWVFGSLIGTGDPASIAGGYAFGAVLMLIAAAVAWWFGVAAERRALEDVARPLSTAGD